MVEMIRLQCVCHSALFGLAIASNLNYESAADVSAADDVSNVNVSEYEKAANKECPSGLSCRAATSGAHLDAEEAVHMLKKKTEEALDGSLEQKGGGSRGPCYGECSKEHPFCYWVDKICYSGDGSVNQWWARADHCYGLCDSHWGYSDVFHIMAHMINSEHLVTWAFDVENSNAVEFDLRYTHSWEKRDPTVDAEFWWIGGATPKLTHHGPPCDCGCYNWYSGGVCTAMVYSFHTCEDNWYITYLLGAFVPYNPSMIYFDNKLTKGEKYDAGWDVSFTAGIKDFGFRGWDNPASDFGDAMHTGCRLAVVILNSLLNKDAFTGFVGLEIPSNFNWHQGSATWGDWHDGAMAWGVFWWFGMKAPTKESRVYFAWQGRYDESPRELNIQQGVQAMLWIKNDMNRYNHPSTQTWKIATSTGISACVLGWHMIEYRGKVVEATQERKWGWVDAVLTWTVDVTEFMRDYLYTGADGMITNFPKKMRDTIENWYDSGSPVPKLERR